MSNRVLKVFGRWTFIPYVYICVASLLFMPSWVSLGNLIANNDCPNEWFAVLFHVRFGDSSITLIWISLLNRLQSYEQHVQHVKSNASEYEIRILGSRTSCYLRQILHEYKDFKEKAFEGLLHYAIPKISQLHEETLQVFEEVEIRSTMCISIFY